MFSPMRRRLSGDGAIAGVSLWRSDRSCGVNWAYQGEIVENRRGERTKAVRTESVSVLKDVSLGYQQVERRGRRSSLSNCVDEEEGKNAGARTRSREK